MFEERLMIKKYKIIISGLVTEVLFRNFIYKNTIKLNIIGYVQNINNKVEAVFEGEQESINKLIELCQKGPSSAIVKDIKITEETVKNEKEFARKN